MNLLITGAFSGDEEFYQKIKKLGYTLFFLQDEKIMPELAGIDSSIIDGVICNALFLYKNGVN